jgi:AcrR family transcriptional regulator
MARKTKIDAEKTRQAILNAAEMLFYEKGVSSTSLGDIAEYAGLTRGAIYWHFKNKVELFDAMHRRIRLPLEAVLEASLHHEDPIRSLRDYWIHAVQELINDDSKRRILEIVFRKCEYVREFEGSVYRLQEWTRSTIIAMTDVFSEAKQMNILREGISPEIAAKSTYSLIVGVIFTWILPQSVDELQDTLPQILTVYFDSLRQPTLA